MRDRPERVEYQELASTLRKDLARGAFPVGERLPTEAQLGQRHGLSRQTVRRALQELVAEGLVYRIRGRGTFATTLTPGDRYLRSFGSIEDLLAFSVDTTLETLEPLERRTDVGAASRLRLDSDEVMVGVGRRSHTAAAFCITRFSFGLELGGRVRERGMLSEAGQVTALTAISVVDQEASAPIAGAHQSISAVNAPAEVAGLIGLPSDASALQIDRLYYDVEGQPLELAISLFNPDRYSYRVELSRSPGR